MDSSSITINIDTLLKWGKVIGFLIATTGAVWRVSSWTTKVWSKTERCFDDIRQFMASTKADTGEIKALLHEGVTNHLTHIEQSLETLNAKPRNRKQ